MTGSLRVAVAGATGTVGRHVVGALSRAGHRPVALARSTGVDLVTGAGVGAAVRGADAVIDVSNVLTTRRRTAVAFFEAGTTHLLEAAASAQVRHVVVLSVVGCDRVDLGYYYGKRRQEELVLQSGQPASVLPSTQFHEFAGQVLDRSRGRVAVVPRMTVRPVAAREVADALVALAAGPPVGRAPELGGPEVHELTDLARLLLRSRGSSRVLLPVRLPGRLGAAMVGGALLPQAGGPRGTQTFTDWLAGPG